jgi:hypothetical protein
VNWIYSAKRFTPEPIWKIITSPYWWWYNRARHQAAALVSPALRRSQSAMELMKDVHRNKRCFIIGNGPSLQKTDLSLLKDEITFGMNRIYLLFPELGFTTTYYVVINTLVIEQCAPEIRELHIPKFVTWRGRQWMGGTEDTYYLDTDYTLPETFSEDVSGRVFEGSTVTYVALQIAYHMGFEKVILIGVDHSFSTKGPPNVTVVSNGEDPDHFSGSYFGKGFRWQLPDLEASERAYRMAESVFRKDGRVILDATIGGKLEVFEKVDYSNLFLGSSSG